MPIKYSTQNISEHPYDTIKKCIIITHDFALSVPKPYQDSPKAKTSVKIRHNSTTHQQTQPNSCTAASLTRSVQWHLHREG